MPFEVVLDTCALYPAHLRDTILRLAERGLYRTLWSGEIIEELDRHRRVRDQAAANRREPRPWSRYSNL